MTVQDSVFRVDSAPLRPENPQETPERENAAGCRCWLSHDAVYVQSIVKNPPGHNSLVEGAIFALAQCQAFLCGMFHKILSQNHQSIAEFA